MNRLFNMMLLLFFSLFTSNSVLAQSEVKEMNKIKRDANYIYSIYTDSTLFDARKGAREQLEIDIELFVENSKNLRSAQKVVVKDIVSKAMEIQMRRGTMFRVFLYVNKKDIFPADIIVVDNQGRKVESPKDSRVDEIPMIKSQTPSTSIESTDKQEDVQKLPQIIADLQGVQSLSDAWEILDRYCTEKRVKKFGLPKNCDKVNKCYWVIQAKDSSSLIILGEGDDERYNYISKQNDKLSNYSGYSAIWFNM